MTEDNSAKNSTAASDRGLTRTVSKQDLRGILTECIGTGLPADFDDTTPFVLDSYAAMWLQHLIEEKYGVLPLRQDAFESMDSLNALHSLIAHAMREADDTSGAAG